MKLPSKGACEAALQCLNIAHAADQVFFPTWIRVVCVVVAVFWLALFAVYLWIDRDEPQRVVLPAPGEIVRGQLIVIRAGYRFEVLSLEDASR